MVAGTSIIAQLTWTRDTGVYQLRVWNRGGDGVTDTCVVIPLVKSAGGGAGIFGAPPLIDPGSSSATLPQLSVDPNDGESRKRVPTVAIEIAQEDWAAMNEFTFFLREASKEASAALHIFADVYTP